jgi:hypothetical protein
MRLDSSVAGVLAPIETDLAAFLALVLAAAALHKLRSPTRARRAAGELLGFSSRGAGIATAAAAAIEAAAAACLLDASWRWVGALLAAALWAVYLGLMGRAILGGRRELDCGCSFGKAHRPLGSWHILRTGSLMLLAAVAAAGLDPTVQGLAGVSGMSLGELACETLAALAFLGLYVALDHVLALGPLRAGARR